MGAAPRGEAPGTYVVRLVSSPGADFGGRLGFDALTVGLSEFAKAEGCFTCLSLLLND